MSMSRPQKRDKSGQTIITDATTAAVVFIMEHLDMLPADKGRIATFFADVIHDAIECAILLDRRERLTASDN
jgi:hypothetical protein